MSVQTLNPPAAPAAAPRANTAVELRNVSHWYGNVVAVNDVSFSLGPGITGLLGPNGAGKSTLLHMLAGFLAPSAGEVLVDGRPAWKNPQMYRSLGLVPEREAVYPFLTGYEFALMNARLHKLPNPEKAAERAIDIVDLRAAMHRRIGGYSKGMRQRAKIAGALVHEPRIVLLDEPFNGMDPGQRMHMMELLRGLADQGRTILISSHILEELHHLANNVLVVVAAVPAIRTRPSDSRYARVASSSCLTTSWIASRTRMSVGVESKAPFGLTVAMRSRATPSLQVSSALPLTMERGAGGVDDPRHKRHHVGVVIRFP